MIAGNEARQGWREVRLRFMFDEIDRRVGTPESDDPLLSVSIHRGVIPRSDMTDREARADDFVNYKCVEPGDVVINRMRAFEGGAGISAYRGIVSSDYAVLRTRAGLEPRFLHHLIRSSWFVGEMIARLRGIGNVEAGNVRTPRINVEDLGDIQVALPQTADQVTIADYLDTETAHIDGMVSLRQRQLALLNESLAARRTSRLLADLDPVSGTGNAPDGWQRPLLGVLVELHRGIDLPTDSREEGTVPVVSSGGVSGTHSIAACQGPGVVTGRYGTIGSVYFVEEPYWPLNTTLYVSDFRGNDPRWVYHLLSVLPLAIDAEKSAVTGINRNVVGQLRAIRPPLAEQRLIAAELDDQATIVHAVGRAITRQVELLMERRQALITAAVTGQLEIPGVAA